MKKMSFMFRPSRDCVPGCKPVRLAVSDRRGPYPRQTMRCELIRNAVPQSLPRIRMHLSKNPRREKGFFDDCEGITKIARKYGKTNGQVVSRWSMQHGVVTTVKAFLPDQIRSEYNVFDFVLSDEDMRIIDGFNIGMRFGYHPDYIDF